MINMKNWLQAGKAALLGGMLAVGLMLPGTAFAASKADLQYVQEVCQQYQQQKSGNMTVHLTFLSSFAKADGNIVFQGAQQPTLLLKGTADGTYTLVFGTTKSASIPFYLEQSEKNILVYYKQTKEWQKAEIPFSAQEYAKLMQQDGDMQDVKEVKVIADNATERTLQITLAKESIIKDIRAGMGKQEAVPANLSPDKKKKWQNEQKQQQVMIDKICDSIQDYNLTWVVDKSTRQLKRESMDLTPILRASAGGALAAAKDQLKPAQQEVLQRMIDSCSLQFDVVNQPTATAEKVVIPENVKKAKLVKPSANDVVNIKL